MVADGVNKPRNLTAKQIGERTGRDKRMVLNWCDVNQFQPPCPHVKVPGARQVKVMLNLDEVKAWLVARGMPVMLTRDLKAEVDDAGKSEVVRPELPAAAAAIPAQADMFARKQAEDLEKDAQRRIDEAARLEKYRGEIDYDTIIARLSVQVEDLSQQRAPDGADAGWAQRWRQAVEGVTKELRQLDSARFEAQQRRKDWIRRSKHEDVLDAAASEFVSAMTAMRGRMPAAIVAVLAEIIPSDKIDMARRLIATYLVKEAEETARILSDAIVGSVEQERVANPPPPSMGQERAA